MLKKLWRKVSQKHAVGETGLISRLLGVDVADGLPQANDYGTFAECSFRANTIVHSCIRKITRASLEPTLYAVTRLPNGELRRDIATQGGFDLQNLLERPNNDQDFSELVEQLIFAHPYCGKRYHTQGKVKPGECGWS